MLSDMQDIQCSASFNGSACIFTPFEVYISLVMHIVLINYMYLLFSCMDCQVANIICALCFFWMCINLTFCKQYSECF